MTATIEKFTCPTCKKYWVDPETGKWNICDDCPHRMPPEASKESPGRVSAKARLICGSECQNSKSDIIDCGNGLSYCATCPNGRLVRDAADMQARKNGKRGCVEIIHPAPRKTVSHWKCLYLDLLRKHAAVLEELERCYKSL